MPGQRRPRLHAGAVRARPRSRPTWSTPCSPTAPATTSTTPTPSAPPRSAPTRWRSCIWDRAAEEILRALDGRRPHRCSAADEEIVVHKNNSDGKGNSYGCHENYLMARETPFGRIVRQITPHFVTRQIFCGAGKVGVEAPGLTVGRRAVPAHPAGRLLRGGGRPRDHAQAAHRQHPRRAARRRPEVPPPPRHHRRRQHVRGRHLPQGRHHRDRAGHDRGRRPRRRPRRSPRRCRHSGRVATTTLRPAARARGRWHHHRARAPVGVPGAGPEVRRDPRPRVRRRGGRRRRARSLGARARRLETDPTQRRRLVDWVAK